MNIRLWKFPLPVKPDSYLFPWDFSFAEEVEVVGSALNEMLSGRFWLDRNSLNEEFDGFFCCVWDGSGEINLLRSIPCERFDVCAIGKSKRNE